MFMNQVRLLVKKSCSSALAGIPQWDAKIAVSSPSRRDLQKKLFE